MTYSMLYVSGCKVSKDLCCLFPCEWKTLSVCSVEWLFITLLESREMIPGHASEQALEIMINNDKWMITSDLRNAPTTLFSKLYHQFEVQLGVLYHWSVALRGKMYSVTPSDLKHSQRITLHLWANMLCPVSKVSTSTILARSCIAMETKKRLEHILMLNQTESGAQSDFASQKPLACGR